jgi:NAD(P)H-dependent flavin oxidoreductase YrpB (nitropropane dioxygenase family)
MRTALSDLLGIEFPICAFSHCRDVVAAVSKAGGIGVFGASALPPDRLAVDLDWLDTELAGRPYGVDLVVPAQKSPPLAELRARIPSEHRRFVDDLARRFEVPPVAGSSAGREFGDGLWGPELAREQWGVVAEHGPSVLVSALGPLPDDIVAAARAKNMRIGGMCGTARHAQRHVAGGADFVVAQGTEAGGHTGEISTMVLLPQVVDAVAPVPVLAAGGIASGRQIAAAFALGAVGVWTGSVWLTCSESSVHPVAVAKLLSARSQDTVRSRARTGKPLRQLRTPWTEAWEQDDAPKPLPPPLQRVLVHEQMQSIEEHGVAEPIGSGVGQVVGMMNERRPAAHTLHRLAQEYGEAAQRLRELTTAQFGGA